MVEKKRIVGERKKAEGAERRGAQTEGLSRANPTMRFAFLCTGVVRNFVWWRGFLGRAAFRARDEKPAVILNSLDDSEGVRPWWTVEGRDKETERRFTAAFRPRRNYFPRPVPLGVDQSVAGREVFERCGPRNGSKIRP